MKHRFKKAMFRYLLEIVVDGNNDPAGKIIQDLSRQTSNSSIQYQLCVSAIRKLEEKVYLNHRYADNIIDFICHMSKKISVYDSQTAEKILNLVMTDDIIRLYYSELAESFVHILDDKDKAENVLRMAFDLLKKEIQNRTKRTMISESLSEGISKDEHYSCNTLEFIRLSYTWIGFGRGREFAKTIVDYASDFAVGFTENLELGEFYIRFPEERYTAFKFFRRAEELASDFDDNWCLCHNLFLFVKNEVWANQVMEKCKASAKTADELCRIAELYGNNKGLPNMEMSQHYFRLAMEKCSDEEQRRCVQDSLENVREQNEED